MLSNINWIVIAGGPGLSADYLKLGLQGVFTESKIHYYDQLGSPECTTKTPPSIEDLIDQLFDVANSIGAKKFGLITHSFGNYLAMRAIERRRDDILAIVMISPMPFISSHVPYISSHGRDVLKYIASIVPCDIMKKINNLSGDPKNGAEIFNLLYPYSAKKIPYPPPRISFDLDSCNRISGEVKDYDDRNLLISSRIPWVCIVGELDPLFVEKDFLAENSFIVQGVGHYPFFEDHQEFMRQSLKAMEQLCQRKSVNAQKYF